MNRTDFARLVNECFKKFGHDNPTVLLADAAQYYNSTEAQNTRARSAAADLLVQMLHEQGVK